jgi:hypothetical protein
MATTEPMAATVEGTYLPPVLSSNTFWFARIASTRSGSARKIVVSAAIARDFGWPSVGYDAGLRAKDNDNINQFAHIQVLTTPRDVHEAGSICSHLPKDVVVAN